MEVGDSDVTLPKTEVSVVEGGRPLSSQYATMRRDLRPGLFRVRIDGLCNGAQAGPHELLSCSIQPIGR
jgi:hypothetical protein